MKYLNTGVFGALARKYYRENRRLGIIFLGIIGIITFFVFV